MKVEEVVSTCVHGKKLVYFPFSLFSLLMKAQQQEMYSPFRNDKDC